MSSWIKKNIVSVTTGDSLWTSIDLVDSDGNEYVPDPNDVIVFSLKSSTDDSEDPILQKRISPETLELRLNPEDLELPVGDYWYDIEVTLNNGFRDTVVGPARFKITPQVTNVR